MLKTKLIDNSEYRSYLLVLLVGLGILIGLLSVWGGVQLIVMLFLFGLCFVPSVIAKWRGSFDIFEPIVFYSVFMFMITVSIFDRIYIQDPFLRHPEWVPWDFSTAFLILSIVYSLYFSLILVGYYSRVEQWVTIPTFAPDRDAHNSTIFYRMGLIYVTIGLFFYITIVGTALEWNLLRLYTTTEPRSQIFADSQHLILGARMLYIGYFVWLIGVIADGIRPRLLHLVPAVFVFGLFLLLGGRGRAMSIILITVILYYYTHIASVLNTRSNEIRLRADSFHKKVKLLTIPVVGAVAGVAVVFIRIFRSWRDFDGIQDLSVLVDFATFGIHNNHLDYLLVLPEAVPEHMGYYWGTLVFRVPLNFIPRSIWNDKPELTVGSELRKIILPDQSGGRDPGLLGQFYADGGIIGIVIGALVFGIVLRFLYITFKENSHSPVMLAVYAIVLATIVPTGIDNNGLWEITNHLLLLIPVMIIDWYVRNRNK